MGYSSVFIIVVASKFPVDGGGSRGGRFPVRFGSGLE